MKIYLIQYLHQNRCKLFELFILYKLYNSRKSNNIYYNIHSCAANYVKLT